ncbi:MAG: TfoX/Sxy family protein [Chthoniobacter sp.]|uniref:TfoX/Sxy family protein n=1 Tax=Chthoniobacter sp. TaxID=2510640 RepID=UPI0032A9F204
MPQKSEFVEYLIEMLQPLGEIRAKPMFGGWGFYADERFFAIVADEGFYVKVDDVSREEFETRGLKPFRYEVRDTKATMDYYEPPPEAMDDRELLCEWARKGIDAAVRKVSAKKKPRKKK